MEATVKPGGWYMSFCNNIIHSIRDHMLWSLVSWLHHFMTSLIIDIEAVIQWSSLTTALTLITVEWWLRSKLLPTVLSV